MSFIVFLPGLDDCKMCAYHNMVQLQFFSMSGVFGESDIAAVYG